MIVHSCDIIFIYIQLYINSDKIHFRLRQFTNINNCLEFELVVDENNLEQIVIASHVPKLFSGFSR